MNAAILNNVGDDVLQLRGDVEVVGPGPGEVRIQMAATGVCHSDLSGMDGTIPTPVPTVLGHEGAGEIVSVGEGVTQLKSGDHVIISWSPPCGTCGPCLRGQAQLCNGSHAHATKPHFRIGDHLFSGFAGTGTFAEQLVVQEQAAIKIPKNVPFDVASLIGCGVTTGVGAAINSARVSPGSSVVVFGCGGVGISIVQGARLAGASQIVAVDRLAAKREMALTFGASHAVAPEDLPTLSGSLTAGSGFDYAFEAIGTSATIRAAYDATRRGGTAVIVGIGRQDDPVTFNAFELFRGEKNLRGSVYGSADVRTEFHRLIGLWQSGLLNLEGMITRRTKLSEVNDALSALKAGDVIRTIIEF